MRRIGIFSVILVALAGANPAWADSALEALLTAPSVTIDNQALDSAALNAVYAPRHYEPIWNNVDKAAAILKTLHEAGRHGLNPADYYVDAISARAEKGGIEYDLLLTDGLMRYASDVRGGRVSPRRVPSFRYNQSQTVDPVAVIASAVQAQDFQAFLGGLPPQSGVYGGLVQALAKLQLIEATGGWGSVSDGRKIEPGNSSVRVVQLRKRLAASGELGEAQLNEDHKYDHALVEAVKAYQRRNGLDDDGVIGRGTLAMLNIPASYRIKQVIANMERIRWQPDNLGARYVYVNVPAYQLVAASQGEINLSMKVIVGRTQRPTPLFSDDIRMVEFNPAWFVPPTIVREDILPHLTENPNYALEHKNVHMFQNGVEVDPATVDWTTADIRKYRLRAPPGPQNPLGTVKFLFPNRFDVYLHDTSEPNLFVKNERAISSGCVRVSNPAALANWLLTPDQENWSDERRQRILDSARQTRLILKTPVPVYLAYITAWLGEDGHPVFRPDIYQLDDGMIAAVEASASQPRVLMKPVASVQPVVDSEPVTVAAP